MELEAAVEAEDSREGEGGGRAPAGESATCLDVSVCCKLMLTLAVMTVGGSSVCDISAMCEMCMR